MKGLGETDVIFNIKLLREGNGEVTLVQSHYVEKMLNHFGYSECYSSQSLLDSTVPSQEHANDYLPDFKQTG